MSSLNPPRRRRSFYRKNYRLPLGAFSCILIWFIWIMIKVPAIENCKDLDWHNTQATKLVLNKNIAQLQQRFQQNSCAQLSVHLPSDLIFSQLKKYTDLGVENGYAFELLSGQLIFRKK